jgi:hypothetical protein
MGDPIAARHRFGDKPKRPEGGLVSRSIAGRPRSLRESGNRKPVPVGENLVVAGWLRPFVATVEEFGALRSQNGFALLA